MLSDDKVNLILTKAGLKPASELDINISIQDERGKRIFMNEQQVQAVLQAINESGLYHEIGQREVTNERSYTEDGIEKPYHRERFSIFISGTKEALERLKAAFASGSDEDIGRALGYPEGAIQAFAGNKPTLDLASLPKQTLQSDAMLFSSPTLSAENWQEEIKIGQRNAEFIKNTAPKIYEEYRNVMLNSSVYNKTE